MNSESCREVDRRCITVHKDISLCTKLLLLGTLSLVDP